MKTKLLSFDFTTQPLPNNLKNKTSKTVFEWKQMILVIAPFFAITLFLHVQMINQMKISENLTEFTNLHTNLLGRKS